MQKCKSCGAQINFAGEELCPGCEHKKKYEKYHTFNINIPKAAAQINAIPAGNYSRKYMRRYNSGKTSVSLAWNPALGAYDLKFNNTNNWDKIQGVLIWLKQTIPSHERDYNIETKVWGIHEKHVPVLKKLLELITDFDFIFIEKPEQEVSFTTFVPLDVYKQTFKEITGEEVNEGDYSISKRTYRRAAMRLHPDKNPNNVLAASQMSSLNEAWLNLEVKLFKVKELAKQET
jgi:hypothetical protein